MLRTVEYLRYGYQCDDIIVANSNYTENSLLNIYKTLIPLEIYMHEFVDSNGEIFRFAEEDAFKNSEAVAQIRMLHLKGEHTKVIHAIKIELRGLIPEDIAHYFCMIAQIIY